MCRLKEHVRFSDLPLEIRDHIYSFALPEPQTIEVALEIQVHLYPNTSRVSGQTYKWMVNPKSPPPALSRLSQEARAFACRYYEPLKANSNTSPVWASYERDTFYLFYRMLEKFVPGEFGYLTTFPNMKPESPIDPTKIQYAAIGRDRRRMGRDASVDDMLLLQSDTHNRCMSNSLKLLPNVKELNIVLNEIRQKTLLGIENLKLVDPSDAYEDDYVLDGREIYLEQLQKDIELHQKYFRDGQHIAITPKLMIKKIESSTENRTIDYFRSVVFYGKDKTWWGFPAEVCVYG